MMITSTDKLWFTLERLRGKAPIHDVLDVMLSLQCLQKFSPSWEKICMAPNKQEAILRAINDTTDLVLQDVLLSASFKSLSNDQLHDLVDSCNTLGDIPRDDWQMLMERMEAEHVTPSSVNALLVKLLAPQPGMAVIDCSSGIGNTLAACLIEAKGSADMYGEDINAEAIRTAIRLSRMYDQPATFLNTDTLGNDIFKNEDGTLKHFDAAVSVAPFGLAYKEKSISEDKFQRFRQDALPRKSSADWLFIQNTLARLNQHGRAVLSTIPSALFVSGKESELRKEFLENDLIDAVIALPAGLFHHTAVKTVCLILNKRKPSSRQYKVQFIDADSNVEPVTYDRGRRALSPESIEEIADIYHQNKEISGYSEFISFNEVRKNKFDLDISLYVQKPIELQLRPLKDIFNDLTQAQKDHEQARSSFEEALNKVTRLPKNPSQF